MKKMWAGRTAGELNKIADKFNASIPFDQRLYRQDITGSIMHAEMLAAKGIIPAAAKDHIIEGLEGILEDLESGKLEVDLTAEDVHMFVEGALTNASERKERCSIPQGVETIRWPWTFGCT